MTTEAPNSHASLAEEKEIVATLENLSDKETEERAEKLKKRVWITNQLRESWRNLWTLRRDTFVERKWNIIRYKLDAVNKYLKEISTSNKRIKEALLSDRKTIVTAVQIALYKAWYLPVWEIDWLRWPKTRWAVDKFQRGNWLWWQKNPWYLNVGTLNKLIEVSTKKEEEKKNSKVEKKTGTPKQSRVEMPRVKTPTPRKNEAPKDNTNVAPKAVDKEKERFSLRKFLGESWEIKINNQVLKGIWSDITKKIWYFKEWQFLHYGNDFPTNVSIYWETCKYRRWEDLNWLWFETCDWLMAFQIWIYSNGRLERWVRFYSDWEKEIGEFDDLGAHGDAWALVNGTRVDANWTVHKIVDWEEEK